MSALVAAPAAPLPARVARPPERPTMLYDGLCRICRAGADTIRSYDRKGHFALVKLQDPDVAARYPEIQRDHLLESMHLLLPDGRILRGANAVRGIMHELPGYRWLELAWLIPGFDALAAWGYAWVAANRYRWNKKLVCDGDVCRVHK